LILVPVFQKKIKLPLHFQSILIKVPGLTFWWFVTIFYRWHWWLGWEDADSLNCNMKGLKCPYWLLEPTKWPLCPSSLFLIPLS
jgi:hypothetical protein